MKAKKIKPTHGGKRPGAGRPKVKDARVPLNARVLPETKKKAQDAASKAGKSLGRYLDDIMP